MRYELQITWDDYRMAQKLHLQPRRRTKILLCCLLALLVLIVLLAGDLQAGTAALVAVACYLFLLFGVLLHYRWKKHYKQYALLRKPMTYEFSRDAFSNSMEYGSVAVPWTEFHKWKEGKNLFLVYQSGRLFNLIPKRIFESPEAQEQLRGYLTEKIGKPVT